MDKSKLSDGEWVHLIGKLKKTPGIRVGCDATWRRFALAVLWMVALRRPVAAPAR